MIRIAVGSFFFLLAQLLWAADSTQLAGKWSFQSGDKFETVECSQSGNSLTFTDTAGRSVEARLVNGKVVVDAWKMKGTISASGKQIRWTNGSVWTRLGAEAAAGGGLADTSEAGLHKHEAGPERDAPRNPPQDDSKRISAAGPGEKARVCFPDDAGAANPDARAHYSFAIGQDAAALEQNLIGKIRTIFGCQLMTDAKRKELFADISVLIEKNFRDSSCFDVRRVANMYPDWKVGAREWLDDITSKTSAAMRCMSKDDRAIFFSEASAMIVGALERPEVK